MRRRLESLFPVLVLIGFLGAALTVNLLLNSAEDRGVKALEESVTSEVNAIAGSQAQRYRNQFSSAGGLSGGLDGEPFELTVDSAKDGEALQGLLDLLESAGAEVRSGFYLLDASDTITQGVLLGGGTVGTTFERAGFDAQTKQRGGVLPVGEGLTTQEPVLTYVLPILSEPTVEDPTPHQRGTFVYEQVVAADSDFNKEIGALKRGDTGIYYFYDSHGTVIASNDSSVIGHMLRDARMLEQEPGFHRFGGDVAVLADVEGPQWRVGFRQDADEFSQSLTGPLQSTGRILIFALLLAGLLLMFLLLRRLRAARAEQERLRRLSEAQQEFISIVSHELRTPVAGVLGFLETSLDHWDVMTEDERKTAVSRAASNARRLQAMTRDVLDTQTIESGQLIHVFERLDLVHEVGVAAAAARELDPDRTLTVEVPDAPVWIQGDADRLQQVLVNLLDNARKNSPAMEPVTISVSSAGSTAEVSVADRGPGIAEESLERIFDKFVRGRGDSVSGTGLGLYISRQIVDAHSGRIWAESEPGQGATFHFTVPVAPADDAGVPETADAGTSS